jgi:hypothetical protein
MMDLLDSSNDIMVSEGASRSLSISRSRALSDAGVPALKRRLSHAVSKTSKVADAAGDHGDVDDDLKARTPPRYLVTEDSMVVMEVGFVLQQQIH